MSIRHTASPGDFYLRFVDPATGETTFPAPSVSPWTLGWIESMDGSLETTELQYAFNFGTVGSANTIVAGHHANDANKGKLHIYTPSGTGGYLSTNTFTTGAYLFLLSADTINGFRLRSCQVLMTQPTDGSAVKIEFVKTLAEAKVDTALDIPGIMTGRSNSGTRKYDQSLARLWFHTGEISDHEMAMMAYGMEITELGKTPKWYFRMNTPTDLTDRGELGLVMSKVGNGTPTAGNAIAFGYDSSNPPSNQAPTITGTPTVNESPLVGQSVTYTRAPTSGIPAPTVTQQWLLNGQDVSGATGVSFLLPADSGGKTVSVRQIATNIAGSTSATSPTKTVAAPPANAVTATAMPAETIYQRLGTSLAITMAGTYTGDVPDRVEIQLYDEEGISILRAWTAIPTPSIGGGSWSGTPVIPQGGMYRRRVRTLKNNVVLATGGIETELWAVGARCGMIGSSSAQYAFNSNGNGGSGFVPRSDVRLRSTAGWSKLNDQGWGISIANDLATRLGVPVGMLGFGVGGATLGSWSAKGSGWNPFAAAAVLDGTGLEACVITVGSNDGGNGTVPSKEIHRERLRTLISNVRAIPGCAGIPIALSGANRRPGVAANDIQFNWIRTAENEVGDDVGVVHIQSLDYPLEDGVHLSKGPSGYPALATRINYQFGTVMSGGVYRRGPKIVSMTVNGSVVTCTIQHRGSTDFTVPAAGTFKAFAADGTAIVVSSVAKINNTSFTVTCVSPPASLRYLDGGDPGTATQLYGNTTPALPMTVETEMQIQQIGPKGVVTSQPAPDGQNQRFAGTTSNATSGLYTLTGSNGGVTVGPLAFVIENNTFDFTHTGLAAGTYTPTLTVSDGSATVNVTGTTPFTIAGLGGGGVVTPVQIKIRLIGQNGQPLPNGTTLQGAWFDQAQPKDFLAPTWADTLVTQNGTGEIIISLPDTDLASGQTGWLIISDSDGNPTTLHKAFSGPVTIL